MMTPTGLPKTRLPQRRNSCAEPSARPPRGTKRCLAAIAALLAAAFGFSLALHPGRIRAGGPLLIESGIPYRWNTDSAVALNLDQGPLGPLSNSEAQTLVVEAAGAWDAVSTSSLRLRLGSPLAKDIEGLSVREFWNLVETHDGTNPIILDSSGAITDELFGVDSGVVGAAGPSLVYRNKKQIVKGFVLINGKSVSASRLKEVRAVLTHEIGHLLNLGHSQLNGIHLGKSVPGFLGVVTAAQVETMYPILISSSDDPHPMATLHQDDTAAISALYPSPSFGSSTGAVLGTVLDPDGVTGLQGINVVARNARDPFADAVSYVSGSLAGSPPDPALAGVFELRGLRPGASYKVYIEEIASRFRSASSVGPRDPPLNVDPSADPAFLEFWNGPLEAADDPPDYALDAQTLSVASGQTIPGLTIILNNLLPSVESVDPNSSSYQEEVRLTIKGVNFRGARRAGLSVTDPIGTIPVYFKNLVVLNSETLSATLSEGSFPGTYRVFVESDKGTSAPGPEYVITEPAPEVTSVAPGVIYNTGAKELTISGRHFLGTRGVWLRSDGLTGVPLDGIRISSSTTVYGTVPAGTYPGEYRAVVANTAGESEPSDGIVQVLEMSPRLSDIVPAEARNSRSVVVRVIGENLSGARRVELLSGETRVELVLRSTSLSEVVVVVPAGLQPGSYVVRLENSVSTVTGPVSFTVKASSSGGGCSAGGTRDSHLDLLPALAAIWILWLLFRPRSRGAVSSGANGP